MPVRLRVILAAVITVMWVASSVLSYVNPDYNPPASANPLMLIVAGSVFGESVVRSAVRRNGNGAPVDRPS